MARPYRLSARRTALIYVSLAVMWILGSDTLADALFPNSDVQSYKGIAFVLATGLLLYAVLSRAEFSMREFRVSLMASREQFERVVENAPEGVIIVSGGLFRYLNPAAVRMLGALDAGQLVGRPALSAVAEEHHALAAERMKPAGGEGRAAPEVEVTLRREDGSACEAAISAAPFDYLGERGAVLFVRDISARKQAERQKEHLEAQVRQAQKMESIGRLAGGVAHDFNNILTVINGYADMLLQDTQQDDPRSEALQEIRDAGVRASGLTRQLLAFSRKEKAHWTVLDVNAVIRESEKMLGRLLGDDIRLRTELDPNAGLVLADASWLHQVLMNLLINARDAMPAGGQVELLTADATVDEAFCRNESEAAPGRYVRLSVFDTGSGMSPEVKQRAFEPFFTTKPSGKGTGLGLSTVYGIVRQFHGWISIESAPGEGTAIVIWLPVHHGEAATPAAPESPRLRGNETVLLVEDDGAVRQASASMLRAYGYAVVAAGGAAEALRLAEEYPGSIDLLLSDVMMPEMSGPALARRLREKLPQLKVMLMSGYREEPVAEADSDLPFISKPFTAEGLARRVRAAIDA